VNKWHKRFIILAHEVASYSKDPRVQVGCIIAYPGRRQFSMGYNGFPAGIADSELRLTMTAHKNDLMVHAELNAVLNARADLTGSTMYVTKPPCVDCCKVMIQAGISELRCPKIDETSSWATSQEFGLALLFESGIKTVHFGDILTQECDKLGQNNKATTDHSEGQKRWCDCNPIRHRGIDYDHITLTEVCLNCKLERKTNDY